MEKTDIRKVITGFIIETKQRELLHVLSYSIGYYGSITPEIWEVIVELVFDGTITRTQEPH